LRFARHREYRIDIKNTKGEIMNNSRLWLLLLVGMLLVPFSARAGETEDYAHTIRIFRESPEAQKYFDSAYGYAVFPVIGKGAVGVGGAFGKGLVYRGGAVTGRVSMVQLSIGFQLGGQAFSEIIFFQDERAYAEFTRGSFEMEATASAVAITAGAQAKAGTTGTSAGASAGPSTGKQLASHYVKGMAIFVHTQGGLMYEASVGGQKFTFEKIN
jgi:lipid-binding SYLF domain-containing protein